MEEKVTAIVGKPPMDYYDRLSTLDTRSFLGEMKKKSRETKGAEPISALVALVLLGVNAKLNDPYVLDSNSRKKGVGFDVFRKGGKS